MVCLFLLNDLLSFYFIRLNFLFLVSVGGVFCQTKAYNFIIRECRHIVCRVKVYSVECPSRSGKSLRPVYYNKDDLFLLWSDCSNFRNTPVCIPSYLSVPFEVLTAEGKVPKNKNKKYRDWGKEYPGQTRWFTFTEGLWTLSSDLRVCVIRELWDKWCSLRRRQGQSETPPVTETEQDLSHRASDQPLLCSTTKFS